MLASSAGRARAALCRGRGGVQMSQGRLSRSLAHQCTAKQQPRPYIPPGRKYTDELQQRPNGTVRRSPMLRGRYEHICECVDEQVRHCLLSVYRSSMPMLCCQSDSAQVIPDRPLARVTGPDSSPLCLPGFIRAQCRARSDMRGA